jgi:protein-tyrosine-phosphatase
MELDVIFVCHGNVNRSRVAEELFRKLRPDLRIDSFAVGCKSVGGKLMTKKMRSLLDSENIPYNINSRSKVLTKNVIENTSHIFVMDDNNIKHFKIRFGDFGLNKLSKLSNLIGEKSIKDPGFSKGIDDFITAYLKIEQCCKILAIEYEEL